VDETPSVAALDFTLKQPQVFGNTLEIPPPRTLCQVVQRVSPVRSLGEIDLDVARSSHPTSTENASGLMPFLGTTIGIG
jgi:hypothetical protein